MAYEKEILTFLSRPENIEISLEIGEYVEKIKPFLLEKFWLTFANTLRSRLNQSDYYDTWEITDSFHYGILQNYTRCSISPLTNRKSKTNLLRVTLEHSTPSNLYSLYFGVKWTNNPVSEKIPLLEELFATLSTKNYPNNWWPTISQLNISGYGKDFLIRVASNLDEFVNEILDLVWDYFTRLEPTLSNINQQLIQEEQK